jgi:hypothetical protein
MNPPNAPTDPNISPENLDEVVGTSIKINEVLKEYSDKDWNYSRITLTMNKLNELNGPYSLWIDYIATNTKKGRSDFQTYSQELTWGSRHSNELGILELISLRLNKALLDLSNDEMWNFRRPVIRLVKKEELTKQGIADALWYRVDEVVGEDFDNR